MSSIQVSVSIEDAYLSKFDDVVLRSKRAGLSVDQLLKELGVLTGSIDESKLAGLRKMKGIASVEASRDIQLPPPDSPIQ